MYINLPKIEQKFEEFKIFIKEMSGLEFTSFDNKYIDEQENYKKQIYSNAVDILNVTAWEENDIGSGIIINKLLEAINQKDNNLLVHDDRRVYNARQDKSLFEVKKNPDLLKKYEKVFFDFYRNKVSDEESFKKIIEISGKLYPFLGYLFFLKSNRKYLPIAPVTFDGIFKELKLDFCTSHKCSWENYNDYLSILNEVKNFLVSRDEIVDEVDLLDAHSFLWIISRHMKEWKPKQSVQKKIEVVDYKFKIITSQPLKREIKAIINKNEEVVKEGKNYKNEFERKQKIGAESEKIVLDFEIRKLKDAGRDDLAKRVKSVSDIASRGYDIISFDIQGEEKHLEVKTTSFNNSFFITKNELETSRQDKSYCIYVVNKSCRNIINIIYTDLESDYTIEPENFRVYF